jgi:hypothetical protein
MVSDVVVVVTSEVEVAVETRVAVLCDVETNVAV